MVVAASLMALRNTMTRSCGWLRSPPNTRWSGVTVFDMCVQLIDEEGGGEDPSPVAGFRVPPAERALPSPSFPSKVCSEYSEVSEYIYI